MIHYVSYVIAVINQNQLQEKAPVTCRVSEGVFRMQTLAKNQKTCSIWKTDLKIQEISCTISTSKLLTCCLTAKDAAKFDIQILILKKAISEPQGIP